MQSASDLTPWTLTLDQTQSPNILCIAFLEAASMTSIMTAPKLYLVTLTHNMS